MEPYNRSMDRDTRITITISIAGLLTTVAGWFAVPVIKARLEGTPLNGLAGIVDFWKDLTTRPVPLWVAFGAVAVIGFAIYLIVGLKKSSGAEKTDLRVVVLPTPPPRWYIGAMGKTPILSLMVHVRMAHQSEHSLEITKVFLKGTRCEAPFLPIVVGGRYDPSTMLHFGVRPIVAKPGQKLKRRIILVDQYGNSHRTESVEFAPGEQPAGSFGDPQNTIKCFFCGETIAIQELCASGSVPAHQRCVK